MKALIYIDKGTPFLTVAPETLSDGSTVWNMHFRGGEVIACVTEKAADQGLALIAKALEIAAGERPLVI